MENAKKFNEERDIYLANVRDYEAGNYKDHDCAYDARLDLISEHHKNDCATYLSAMKYDQHHLKAFKPVGYDDLEFKVCYEKFCKERTSLSVMCPINVASLDKIDQVLDEVDQMREDGANDQYHFCDIEFQKKNSDKILSYDEILEKYPRFKGREKFQNILYHFIAYCQKIILLDHFEI